MTFCQYHHWNKFNKCEGYCQLELDHLGDHETTSLRPETRDVEGPKQARAFWRQIQNKENAQARAEHAAYEARRAETEFGNLHE